MLKLKPFWRYYGGKFRAAPRYPAPLYSTIVEPFAGAAGYSLRYPDRRVILVELYPVIAEIWRYLIQVPAAEIRRIPTGIEHVDDLPTWVPTPARNLIGWWFNSATVSPRKSLSNGRRMLAILGRKFEGWTEATRERIATQVEAIRHWRCIEGSYEEAPEVEATYFVDPPYSNMAGSYYVEHDVDYGILAAWCRSRRGQVIVCENEGADWLPFRPFALLKPGVNGKGSREVIWEGGCKKVKVTKVESSNLAAVAVDGADLLIRFRSGARYRYPGAAWIAPELLAAESAGKFFAARIRPSLPFVRLCKTPGCPEPAADCALRCAKCQARIDANLPG